VVCAVSYAVANGTTLVTLADPVAGYNPSIFLTAFACGASWSFLRERTGRITPGLFSHAALSYLGAQYLGRLI
jgi:membrane protease YdiL (CAAX protease family)